MVGWSGLRGRSMAGAKYGLTLSNRSVLLGMSTVEEMLGLAAAAAPRRPRRVPIIGFGGLAVLVCWVVVLGVVGPVGGFGVGVLGRWWRWSGSLGAASRFFGVLGGVGGPAGGGVGESEVGEEVWDSVWVGDSIFAKPRLDALLRRIVPRDRTGGDACRTFRAPHPTRTPNRRRFRRPAALRQRDLRCCRAGDQSGFGYR